MRNQRGFPIWYRRGEKDQEKIEHHKTLRARSLFITCGGGGGGGGGVVDHMEDQIVLTGNGRGISRRQWSIKYSIKVD